MGVGSFSAGELDPTGEPLLGSALLGDFFALAAGGFEDPRPLERPLEEEGEVCSDADLRRLFERLEGVLADSDVGETGG